MRAAVNVVMVCLAALAWIAARTRPEHRPLVAMFAAGVATDGARFALLSWIRSAWPEAERAAPWTGSLRAAGVVDSALFLAWPAVLAALSLVVLGRRRAWPAAVGLALTIAVVAILNPRGDALARLYLGAELAAGMVGAVCIARWIARREPATLTTSSAASLAAGHLAGVVLAGPYRVGPFASWHLAQAAYLAIGAWICVLHMKEILCFRDS